MLRSIRYGEADRILHLYTPHRGRVGAIAKGVRRARSRFGGRLEPFFRANLVLHEGRSDLLTVTSAETLSPHARLRTDAARARRRGPRLRRRDAPVRRRGAQSRRLQPALPRARAARRGAGREEFSGHGNQLAFRLKLLLAAGLAPQLAPAPPAASASTSPASRAPPGGVVCPACEAGSFPLHGDTHAFMVAALGQRLADGRGPASASARCARPSARSPTRSSITPAFACAPPAPDRIAARGRRYAVGLRLRGGIARDARPARRQGRQRRGDDARARGRARARRASRSPPRRASPTCARTPSPTGSTSRSTRR